MHAIAEGVDTATSAERATYVSIATGRGFYCGIDATGTVECWPTHPVAEGRRPCAARDADVWTADGMHARRVAAGGDTVCVITVESELRCSPRSRDYATPPPGRFSELSVGFGQACALGVDGDVYCWGTPRPSVAGRHAGPFIGVSTFGFTACALDAHGRVTCWGETNDLRNADMVGPYTQIDGRCGRGADGVVTCWSGERHPLGTRPVRAFSTGAAHCGIDTQGALACGTGLEPDPTSADAEMPALQVAAAYEDPAACALRADGTVDCWGSASMGCHVPARTSP